MAKKRNVKRFKKDQTSKRKSVLNSDDEDSRNDRTVRQDDDEIDEFYAKKDRILLDGRAGRADNLEPEQVYGMSSEEDSDEENELLKEDHVNDMVSRYVKKKELDSDIEDQEEDVSDSKAWGRKRQDFYENDYIVKEGTGMMSEKDKEIARLEEEEALAIQKRLAEEVDEDVFGLNELAAPTEDAEDQTAKKEKNIEVDLSKLSKKKLLKMVKEESPELQGLLEDCKEKLRELSEETQPLLDLFKEGKLPDSGAKKYVIIRHNFLVAYTTNICFYLSLKAKRVNIRNHPIIKRLGQMKRLIGELDATRQRLLPQIEFILERAKSGSEIPRIGDSKKIRKGKAVVEESEASEQSEDEDSGNDSLGDNVDIAEDEKRPSKRTLTSAEKEIMSFYEDLDEPKSKRVKQSENDEEDSEEEEEGEDGAEVNPADMFGDTDSENDEPVFRTSDNKEKGEAEENEDENEEEGAEDDDGRRAINYQISKNKGLTPRRKKEYRNPRVKHRIKFRKANIRRKGQVRAMRNESGFYGGEMSGINKQVVKSVKLK